jgi:hypothetical protein
MSLSGTISALFQVEDARTVGLSTARIGINKAPATAFTDGSGALMANVIWHAVRTFSGTTDNLDLNGVLTDAYGSTVSMLRVKGWYFLNLSTANNVVIGAGTTPWVGLLNATGTLTMKPGDWFVFGSPGATGWTVVAATGDILMMTGTSGQTYEVGILGASA